MTQLGAVGLGAGDLLSVDLGWHHERRMRRVDDLVMEIGPQVLQQVFLRLGVKVQAWLVEQQHGALGVAALCVGRERDVERKKPAQTESSIYLKAACALLL
jgi:hypothetical protein